MMTLSLFESFALPKDLQRFWNERAPLLVSALLAIAVGAQLASALTRYFGAGDTPAAAESPLAAPAAVGPSIDLAGLLNAHLFGVAAAQPSGDAANAPRTAMALVLAGVIAVSDPKAGYAMIGDNAATAKFVRVGDALPGGARLNAVYADRVLLERGGALESLQLPQQSGAVRVTPPSPVSTSANPTMDRVRQLVAQDPSLIADIIRPQPVIAQGKQRGFRVYPGRNAAAFNRLGLRPGDLVTAINGTPLDDPARGEEIFRTLGSAAAANITIMRNGRQNELTLDMASVTAEAEQLLGTQGLGGVDQQAQVPGAPQ